MCGITGFINLDLCYEAKLSQLTEMVDTIYHRGPDDFIHSFIHSCDEGSKFKNIGRSKRLYQ